MNRRKPPSRFSDQINLRLLKRGIELRRTQSETKVDGTGHPQAEISGHRTTTHHHSVPNPSGKFNYELGRTGFLGDTKIRAKRLAQNPKRFLDTYVQSRRIGDEQEFVPTELPELEDFIQNLTLDNERFEIKKSEFSQKAESAKFRNFLLAMSSTTSIEVDPKTLAFLEAYSGSGDVSGSVANDGSLPRSKMFENAESMETLVKSYLEKIRSVDTSAIQKWIGEFLDLENLELPYGVPSTVPTSVPEGTEGDFGKSREVQAFLESTTDHFLILDGEYHNKITEISNELRQLQVFVTESNWTLEESSLLFYVLHAFNSDVSAVTVLPLQLELMRRLFPEKSQGEITRQKFRLRTKKTLEEKRGAIVRGWIKDKQDLSNKASVAWQEVTRKRLAEMEQKISFKKQRDVCEFWAERLATLRRDKCGQIRKLKVIFEPIEKLKEDRIKNALAAEAARREAVKIEIEQYRSFKEGQVEMRKKEIEFEQKAEKEAIKERSVTNKKRVQYRENQRHLKENAKKELEEALAQRRREQDAQLEATKELVNIDYDPANVVAATHASMVRRHETIRLHGRAQDEKMASIFRDCYSFSTETVLQDRRLRLQVKLKEAGLLDTPYARQVLMAMEPKPKPHLVSQVKLDQEE